MPPSCCNTRSASAVASAPCLNAELSCSLLIIGSWSELAAAPGLNVCSRSGVLAGGDGAADGGALAASTCSAPSTSEPIWKEVPGGGAS